MSGEFLKNQEGVGRDLKEIRFYGRAEKRRKIFFNEG
jgi:hypothetical protein